MEKIQFRLSGTGGQGLITAGIILGEAAVLDNKKVIQTQSYGPEARGGASKAEVIISNDEIFYPKVSVPDFLLTMSQEAAKKYGQEIKEGGIILVDSSMVSNFENPQAKIIEIPITKLAREEIGKNFVANIIALGAIVGITKIVTFESLKEAVLNRIPTGSEEINIKALELGLQWGSM
jgi:2-oxoglutarate ferredoxin oxidoreductase subunit gamma